MIDQDSESGNYFIQCDICGKVHDETFSYYDQAEHMQKKLGWKTRPYEHGVGYDDICTQCQKG